MIISWVSTWGGDLQKLHALNNSGDRLLGEPGGDDRAAGSARRHPRRLPRDPVRDPRRLRPRFDPRSKPPRSSDRRPAGGRCRKVFADKKSGKNALRPELQACHAFLSVGDTLVVLELARYGRSLHDLITMVGHLRLQPHPRPGRTTRSAPEGDRNPGPVSRPDGSV
ncbi:recombinase family protein [Nonomuraea sp. NPDC001831]|uniref:recombinase family protein n=1 Tax=Nonomuraea sp. NPDC001831 TaxID=3364340 RepID=UPI003686A4B4